MQPEAFSRPELHMHLERNRTMVTTPPKHASEFVDERCLAVVANALEGCMAQPIHTTVGGN